MRFARPIGFLEFKAEKVEEIKTSREEDSSLRDWVDQMLMEYWIWLTTIVTIRGSEVPWQIYCEYVQRHSSP